MQHALMVLAPDRFHERLMLYKRAYDANTSDKRVSAGSLVEELAVHAQSNSYSLAGISHAVMERVCNTMHDRLSQHWLEYTRSGTPKDQQLHCIPKQSPGN